MRQRQKPEFITDTLAKLKDCQSTTKVLRLLGMDVDRITDPLVGLLEEIVLNHFLYEDEAHLRDGAVELLAQWGDGTIKIPAVEFYQSMEGYSKGNYQENRAAGEQH